MIKYDAVVVGGGHNGLVAATLLARGGKRVAVLERLERVGGAAVSERVFAGVDANLSKYSYLVSLFPPALRALLGLRTELRPRAVGSYPPAGTGFDELRSRLANRVAPTLLEPLRSRDAFRRLLGEDAWLLEQPLSVELERAFDDDVQRGIELTDATIGTFAPADDPELRQNRCWLYHVVGGPWDVPVGGMGALTSELAAAAREAGAEIRTGIEVTSIDPDGGAVHTDAETVTTRHVVANVAPAVLARLLGSPTPEQPEGSQLKINMLLKRLPRPKNGHPEDAFTGTLHVHERYSELQAAYDEAVSGRVPSMPPCELYCHSLTDPSILSAELRAGGAQTLTLFGLHMPARLFREEGAKRAAVEATLASVDSILAEPLTECLYTDANGEPCLEAVTPVELEAELAMPGGHIFHRDLSWPFAESDEEVGRWGVETEYPNVWLCGAGARRGGAVSGIPGHNAARAILRSSRRAADPPGVPFFT